MASKANLFASFWVYPAFAGLLIYLGRLRAPSTPGVHFVWSIAGGCLLWTLIEYTLHRYVFHSTPSNPRLAQIVHGLHLEHHQHPRDPEKILVRLRVSLPLSFLVWLAAYVVSGSPIVAAGIMTGIWTGFLYYELVHYRVHTSSSIGGIDRQRRGHFHHHFIDDRKRFGVTSPLWDWIFRTY